MPNQLHLEYKETFFNKVSYEWGLNVVPELSFCEGRLWRMDYAFPDAKVAVEVEGGTWTGGRHTTGSGFKKDAEKYNTAASLGWLVLKATPDMLVDDDFLVILFDTLVLRGAIHDLQLS